MNPVPQKSILMSHRGVKYVKQKNKQKRLRW